MYMHKHHTDVGVLKMCCKNGENTEAVISESGAHFDFPKETICISPNKFAISSASTQ